MRAPKTPLPWVIYLLHFPSGAAGFAHYVGITTPRRLPARMREHASGRGAHATARACQLGLEWSLATFWPTDDPGLEQKLQSYERLDMFCPVCFGRPPLATYQPSKKGAHTKWTPSDKSLLISLQPGQGTADQDHEKGGTTVAAPPLPYSGQS